MSNAKRVVEYRPIEGFTPEVGFRTWVVPVNHPDAVNVDNGYPANTSVVVWYDSATGCFDTLYSRYVPAQQ